MKSKQKTNINANNLTWKVVGNPKYLLLLFIKMCTVKLANDLFSLYYNKNIVTANKISKVV